MVLCTGLVMVPGADIGWSMGHTGGQVGSSLLPPSFYCFLEARRVPVYTCCPSISVRSSYSYYQTCLGLGRNLQHHSDHSIFQAEDTELCIPPPSPRKSPPLDKISPRTRSVLSVSPAAGPRTSSEQTRSKYLLNRTTSRKPIMYLLCCESSLPLLLPFLVSDSPEEGTTVCRATVLGVSQRGKQK